MNMKKTIVCLLAMAVVVLCQSLTACKEPEPEHEHDWGAWVETAPATATADIMEIETCKTCGATQTRIKFQKNFSITLLDKTVTVTDARTGTSAQNLEQLGVMQKLRDAGDLINTSNTIDRTVFDRVLAKGMVIELDAPATINQSYRTRGDGKTMILDINYIADPANPANRFAGFINLAVRDYLDQELEKVS
jgi:hypothetical protein